MVIDDPASLDVTQQGRAPAAVRVSGLRRSFGDRPVLKGIELEVALGEFVGLIGRSGCGKSTLLRIVAGLDRDGEGEVEVRRNRSVAFQQPRLLPWRRVWKNVVLGMATADKQLALRALEEVGLAEHADQFPSHLSGGEAQRLSLARALVREPALLLLDEPLGALDALTRLQMQAVLERLWTLHRPAVIMVTHDVEEALLLSDRVLLLEDGRLTREIEVRLERPRSRAHPEFAALRLELLQSLGAA